MSHDSRVLKETKSLLDANLFGWLEIAGFAEAGYLQKEIIDRRYVWRVALKSRGLPKDIFSQSLKFFEWQQHIVEKYRQNKLGVIHCHDLEPLPIGVRLKKLTGAKLIYDAHELESERNGLHGFRQQFARIYEAHLMKYVDAMITVSPSIMQWYRDRFPDVPISLVRNIPDPVSEKIMPVPLRQSLEVPDDSLLFIYLGGLSKGRGIELALKAFMDNRVRHHLLFMGTGLLKASVEDAGKACERIHYRPPVPPGEVLGYASGADIGLCLIEDTCLSYRFCLPNKLFESLMAGIPVLVSDLPDQAAIVHEHEAGWVVRNDSEEIIDFLINVANNDVKVLQQDLFSRVTDLSWKNEVTSLLSVYDNLLEAS